MANSVHVELAEHRRACVPQVLRDRALIGRRELAEDVGAGCRAHALCAEQVLDAERRAFERAALALGKLRIRSLGHVDRLVWRDDHIGVQRFVRRRNVVEEGLRDFLRRKLLRLQAIDCVGEGELGQVESTSVGSSRRKSSTGVRSLCRRRCVGRSPWVSVKAAALRVARGPRTSGPASARCAVARSVRAW